MSLVIAIKCSDGLVLAADSRSFSYHFNPEIPESDQTFFRDKSRKLFSFRSPYKIGVLSYDFHGVSVGIGAEEKEVAAELHKHSIDRCVQRFKKQLFRTPPKKSIKVCDFRNQLYRFLIRYWEYYQDKRRSAIDKMNQQVQNRQSNQVESQPRITLEVKLLVAGFNEGEQRGHVFPVWLTDDDEEWDGSHYRGTLDCVEMIPQTYGMFCGGVTDFVMPMLRADEPREIIKNLQRGCTEAIVDELVTMKSHLNINYVAKQSQPGFFSCDEITAYEAQRLAQLLIKGTADFFGGKGAVGGPTRICTINPLSGTKCRIRS
ncbi:MAG: hypothetical protein WAL97_05205 [Halobacteriota archaeon]